MNSRLRTLQHYDRLGLLNAHRTASGYRSYEPRDLERLEQFVALKAAAAANEDPARRRWWRAEKN